MRVRSIILIAMVSMAAPTVVWAEDGQPSPGKASLPPQTAPAQQPGPVTPGVTPTTEETAPPQETEMPPISGGIQLEPGSRGSSTSYILPSFQWTGYFDRTISLDNSIAGTVTESVFVGNLVLQQVRSHLQLNLDYSGGAQSYGSSYLNNQNAIPPGWSTVQSLSFAGTLKSRHAQLTLGDEGIYLPESPFGYAGLSGLQSFGEGSGGSSLGNQLQFNPLTSPTQSILTVQSRRVVNEAMAEFDYSPTLRSTFTVTATYGLTRFLDSGFYNSHTFSLLAGYNFRLTRRDEISVSYLHSEFVFDQSANGILERGFLAGYSHKFGARITVTLNGGPLQNEIAQTQGGNIKQAFWSTNDSLHYASRFADFNGTISRFTTPGSGVLAGAETDFASLSVSRSIVGKLRGSVDAGHSYNKAVQRQANGETKLDYEAWQGGVTLSHEYGKHTSLYAQYQFQYQIAANPVCFLGGCRTYYERHMIGGGINWHGSPIRRR